MHIKKERNPRPAQQLRGERERASKGATPGVPGEAGAKGGREVNYTVSTEGPAKGQG